MISENSWAIGSSAATSTLIPYRKGSLSNKAPMSLLRTSPTALISLKGTSSNTGVLILGDTVVPCINSDAATNGGQTKTSRMLDAR